MTIKNLQILVLSVALGLMAFLMMPAVQTRCVTSPRARSSSNLLQIGFGLFDHETHNGKLPTLVASVPPEYPIQSWITRCLPFLGKQELLDGLDLARPWDDPANRPIFQTDIGVLVRSGVSDAPVAPGLAPSHYAGNVQVLGSRNVLRTDQIKDGAANTILAGEVGENFSAWGDPDNLRDPKLGINKSPDGFGSPWTTGSFLNKQGGANVLFADGSVRFVREGIDPKILRALGTPDGGETLRANPWD